MAATIRDIKERTGLSLATISKYLNGGNVLPENRIKIEAAIKELHYSVNEIARGLVTSRTRTVGVVVYSIESLFNGTLLHHIGNALRAAGYGLLICDSMGDAETEAQNIKFLVNKKVDGIIVVPVSTEAEFLEPAKNAGIPAVLLDRAIFDGDYDCVRIDNRITARKAVVEDLEKLGLFCRSLKNDFWLMGEVIHGDYSRWVNDGTLHAVTNYTLHKALFSGHNDHNYFEIAHTVKRLYEMGGNRPDGLRLYNFSDNHDVERIINKINNKAAYYPVHILVYTLPGVPSIYYGSECGIEGRKEKGSDASLRPALNFDNYKNAVKENDHASFISRLSKIRKVLPALSYGDYRESMLTNRQYAYTRNCGDSCVIVTVNNDDNQATINGRGAKDGNYVGALSGNKLSVCGGNYSAEVPGNYGEIWVPENEAGALIGDIKEKPIKSAKVAATPVTIEPVKQEPANNVVEEVKTVVADDAKTVDNKKAACNAACDETTKKSENANKSDTAKNQDTVQKQDSQKTQQTTKGGAAAKYNLDVKYSAYNPYRGY